MQIQYNTFNLFCAWLDNLKENANGESATVSMLQNKQKTTAFETLKSAALALSKIQNQVYSKIIFLFIGMAIWYNYKKKAIGQGLQSFMLILTLISVYITSVSAVSFWQGDRFLVLLVPYTLLMAACVYRWYQSAKTA